MQTKQKRHCVKFINQFILRRGKTQHVNQQVFTKVACTEDGARYMSRRMLVRCFDVDFGETTLADNCITRTGVALVGRGKTPVRVMRQGSPFSS